MWRIVVLGILVGLCLPAVSRRATGAQRRDHLQAALRRVS